MQPPPPLHTRTHAEKVADKFDSRFVLQQAVCAGLLEVCRIRKLGFPVRLTPETFFERYLPLSRTTRSVNISHGGGVVASEGGAAEVVDNFEVGMLLPITKPNDLITYLVSYGIVKPTDIAVGRTKIFLKVAAHSALEMAPAYGH